MNTKNIHKNLSNAWLDGVCAGIANYYNINVKLLRLFVFLLGLSAPLFTIMLYIIVDIILSNDNDTDTNNMSVYKPLNS